MKLKCCEKTTIKMPVNGISEEGIIEVQNFLRDEGLPRIDRHAVDFEWLWVTKRGTFPKRLARFMKKTHDRELTQKQLSDVGTLAARHCEKNQSITYDITNRFDWNAGAFGDHGSCFWTDNSAAKDVMMDNGAFALRVYKNETGNGCGRCWILPCSKQVIKTICYNGRLKSYELSADTFALINGYHLNGKTLVYFARLFAFIHGLSYKQIDLRNNGSCSGMLYINSGTAFISGMPDDITKIERLDLEWETDSYRDNNRACDDCGDEYDADNGDWYRTSEGRTVCYSCRDNDYFVCECCDELCPNDESQESPDGGWYCSNCYDDRCTMCRNCDNVVWRDDVVLTKIKETDKYEVACCSSCAEEIEAEREAKEDEDENKDSTAKINPEVKV